jgi:hypothetical protein
VISIIGAWPVRGVGAAAHQRVAGVGGEVHHLAGGHLQAGGAHLQRALHEAEAGNDQAAEEVAFRVERVHGGRRAHHHHQGRPGRVPGLQFVQHTLACANQRHPAVGAQPAGVVVAVVHTTGADRGHDPARFDVPEVELVFHAPAYGVAGHRAAQHCARGGQAAPMGLSQVVDGFQEHRTVPQQRGAGLRAGVQRPFQAGVADVYGQKAHGQGTPAAPCKEGRERSSAFASGPMA